MNNFIESQLAVWPEAKERYLQLGKTERRKFQIGDFNGFFQFNPARVVSTGAKTDARSIAERPCFLCGKNRPEIQIPVPLLDRWELLLNPFPIFPVHFTIASKNHEPQSEPPVDMASMADMYPDLAIFFNGAKAGASAPDHLHLQAVLKSELPIIKLTEENHPATQKGIVSSGSFELDLPFRFYSAVIAPDGEGVLDLFALLRLTGEDENGKPDPSRRNVILWKDDAGWLRGVVIPRRAHRPTCYGTEPGKRLVSPGTIDMAGVVILPREEDFRNITADEMRQIYAECGLF